MFNFASNMKKQVTRVSIKQSSKVAAILYFIFGFIYTLIGIPVLFIGGEEAIIMGVIYLCMPVIMGIFGFIGFAFFAFIYNKIAAKVGGFEFETSQAE